VTIDTFIVQQDDDAAVGDPQTLASSAKWALKFLECYFLHTNTVQCCLHFTLYLRWKNMK